MWSTAYVLVAVAFGGWLWWAHGGEPGMEYFAGYIVEKSLSIDNLFVFVIIMTTFSVPEPYQHKVLTFGIALALVMRAVFIAVGATLIAYFSVMFLLFGLLLIVTGVQLFRHRDQDPDIDRNPIVRAARKMLPITDAFVGGRMTTRVTGRRVITPLFLVLVAIGGVDLLFALDSIPAVFGGTDEAYIVFAVVLAVVTVASLIKTRRDPSARAHAGSVTGRFTADITAAGSGPSGTDPAETS